MISRILGVLGILVSGACALEATATGYYVSGTGNDSWSGLLPSPNATNTDGPFLTLARAQHTMQTSSTVKTTFIRAGIYFPPATLGSDCYWGGLAAINLIAADSGETWSYYPPDGYNTAVLDGAAASVTQSGPTQNVAGAPPSKGLLACAFGSYNGATNVTIDGLSFQHWLFGPLGVNGSGNSAINFTFTNNIVHDTRIVPNGGTIQLDCGSGSVISNNYIYNVPLHGIGIGTGGSGCAVNNVTISGNFILNSCAWAPNQLGGSTGGDCGGIYAQLPSPSNSNVQITNNYIRDINSTSNGAGSFGHCCALGVYLDGATYNVSVLGNVITGIKSACYLTHGGGNHFINNLCDIGAVATQYISIDVWADGSVVTGGNTLLNNVIVTNQRGGGNGFDGQNTCARPSPSCFVNKQIVSNNAYFNYGGSSVANDGVNGATNGDSNPAYLNPWLSCWAVGTAPGSPVSNAPVSFPGIKGSWGPPGFVVPQTGTAPSWPHDC